MKKVIFYIIGFIAGHLMLSYLFSFLPLNSESASDLIAIILVTAFAVTLWLDSKIQNRRRKKVIPENVGVRSYIDESNGTIYLYSYDYQTRGGMKWAATSKAITIVQNWDSSAQTIPFPRIKTVNLHQDGQVSRMIITIHETYQHGLVDGSGAFGTETRIKAVDFEIDFHTHDFSIAQKIQEGCI